MKMGNQDETKPGQTEETKEIDHYEEVMKEILSEENPETETKEEKNPEDKTEEKPEDKKEETEKEFIEDKEEKKKEEKKKEENGEILGKTTEEINEIINKRTQEAVQKHEDTLKDVYEAEKNELTTNTQIQQIEQKYQQYEQSLAQINNMLQNGEIDPQQYSNAINKATADMHQLKVEYEYLQNDNRKANIPKIKRGNDEYYKKIQAELPEYKDPIVKKYAESLKEKIYDAGGIDIAKGGFTDYVRDFIASAVQEAEIRGYQKVKNEIQNEKAKAKAKTATQTGGSIQTRSSMKTADDMINASEEDLLKYMY